MSILGGFPIPNLMNMSSPINYGQCGHLNSVNQFQSSNFLDYSNNPKPKNQSHKNITFSSIEQFLHYKMTGRKPHPKVKFTPQEDELLKNLVQEYGENDNWATIAKKMTITYRNQRQCKERWFNYLSPNINNSPLTREEDEKLEALYEKYGAKWVQIAKYFPARTDINIRSRWLVLQRRKKKLGSKQIDDSDVNSPSVNANQDSNQSRNLNLPMPQINQSQNLNQYGIDKDDIAKPSVEESAFDKPNYESLFSFENENEKDSFSDESMFNFTPVELTMNDSNSFDSWNF